MLVNSIYRIAVAIGVGGSRDGRLETSPTRSASATPGAFYSLSFPKEQESLRQLAAGVAHDYNNLLTSMLCGAGIALENLSPDHPARPALEIASDAVQRAADLTRQLMAYAGVAPFAGSQVNLSALVRKLIVSIRPSLPNHVQVKLDLAVNVSTVCDYSQIEQLLQALITNAVEAIGDKAGVVSIRTRAVHTGDPARSGSTAYAQIDVTDSGCGMDDITVRRVFEPFFSTKFLGRGMGLPAAAGIVRSHRGTIEVRSAPGSGSRFRVCFPGVSADD